MLSVDADADADADAAESVQHVHGHTLSAAQVADLTGKSRSQITRDLNGRKFYCLSVGRHSRIPSWQFADGRALPGLADVVPAIPDHLHPTSVVCIRHRSRGS